MRDRAVFSLKFADGGALELGRRTRVMGILNVTPDSFSDGGRHAALPAALQAAAAMVEAGADIVDVGGESTRPGAAAVDVAEEIRRVVPVIDAIKRSLSVRVSVDTTKPEVARRALDQGADLINDVSALREDGMLELARDRGVPVVLMHMRGTPRTMQGDVEYGDLVATVRGFLEDRTASAIAAGISGDRILLDPGLGFGKSASGNLALLRELPDLARLGRPILIGASRKSFIGKALDLPLEQRLEGGLAVAAYASAQGAHVIRVHDVSATVRAVRMIDAIRDA